MSTNRTTNRTTTRRNRLRIPGPVGLAGTLAVTLAVTALPAQDLEVGVVRDPAANVAMYTATVSAPPGSSFFLFGSLATTPFPYGIPGIFNALELDPLFLLQIGGPSTVGPLGSGTLGFPLPLAVVDNIELPFQALVVDPGLNLAISSLATGVVGYHGGSALEWEGGYKRHLLEYHLCFRGAAEGDKLEIKINGGAASTCGNADASGRLGLYMPVRLSSGARILVERNGSPAGSWTWR